MKFFDFLRITVVTLVSGAALGLTGFPAHAATSTPTTTINGVIDFGQYIYAANINNQAPLSILGANTAGYDTQDIPAGQSFIAADLPFNIQGQQIMDMTLIGLGVNIGMQAPEPGPTEALDVNGYVRIRAVNGWGGALPLNSQSGALPVNQNGPQIWMSNLIGMFSVIGDGWSTQLFAVDQTGNAASLGDVLSLKEFQTNNAARVIGGGYGALWYNDGVTTALTLTSAGDPYGGSYTIDATGAAVPALNDNGASYLSLTNKPLKIDNATGNATLSKMLAIGSGTPAVPAALTFPDASTQKSDGSYGGAFSTVTNPAGVQTCTANYKTHDCSCPANMPNQTPTIQLTAPDGSQLVAYTCYPPTQQAAGGYIWIQSTVLTPYYIGHTQHTYMQPIWTATQTLPSGAVVTYTHSTLYNTTTSSVSGP